MHKLQKTTGHHRPLRPGHHLIREWRKYRDMTMVEVASHALDEKGNPMTSGMIGQLEAGRAAYTQNSLERIAKALRVETWMLLAVHPDDQDHWLVANGDSPAWRGLPEKERMCVWRVVCDVHHAAFISLTSHWGEIRRE